MIKLFDWLSEKAVSAKNYVMETGSQLSTAAHLAYTYAPNVVNFSSFSQFWQGFTVSSNPNVLPAVAGSPKTQRVILSSLISNVAWYIGSAFTYEVAKSYMHSTMPYMDDSYTEFGMDCMAAWYFTLLSMRIVIDNNSYNLCIAKTVADDNPNPQQAKQCPCGTVAIARASIASPFYYLSNIITAKFFEKMLPFGEYLSLPLLAAVYGQCFTEYMLGGLCTEHRYKELAKNNAFSFGLGVSFLMANYLCNALIGYTTGFQNSHMEKAVFYLVFQYYILASLLMDKPLPGKTLGKDVFFHGRLVMESLLKQGSDFIVAALQNPNNQFVLKPVVDFLQKFTPLQIAKKMFLYRDQQTLEDFVKSPPIELFFDLRGDDIQKVLQLFIDVRSMPLTRRLAYVTPYVPDFLLSSEIKKVLNFLVKEKLDGVLENVNDFITTARLKIKIYDKKALQQISRPEHPLNQEEPRITEVIEENPAIEEKTENIILPSKDDQIDETFVLLPSKEEVSLKPEEVKQDVDISFVNSTAEKEELKAQPKEQAKEEPKKFVIIEDYFDRVGANNSLREFEKSKQKQEDKDLEDWEFMILPSAPNKGLQQNSFFSNKQKNGTQRDIHANIKKTNFLH